MTRPALAFAVLRRARRLVPLAAVAATACADPTLDVVFDYQGRAALRDAITRFELAVYQLSPTDDLAPDETICDRIALGRLSNELLDPALRTVIRASRTTSGEFGPIRLDDIPRLGAKQLVFTGYSAGSVVLGGGCVEVGDVDGDTVATLPIEPTLITRVVTREPMLATLTLPTTAEVQIIAREVYTREAPADVGAFRVTLRNHNTEAPWGQIVLSTDQDESGEAIHRLIGLKELPSLGNATPIGPVELSIYSRWADQANRIPAIVMPRRIGALTLGPEPNLLAPSWSALIIRLVRDDESVLVEGLAGLYASPSTPPRVAFFQENGNGFLPWTTVPVGDARALAGFERDGQRRIVTLTGTHWAYVNPEPPALELVAPSTAGPADQLVAFPPCGPASPSIGLIAIAGRRALGVQGPHGGTNDAITEIAALIQEWLDESAEVTLQGAECGPLATDSAVQSPVLAVRVRAADRDETYFLTPGQPTIKSPFVGPVVVTAEGPSVSGAVITPTGVVVTSHRFKLDPAPRFVPDGLAHPLPAVPIALRVEDYSGDENEDTVAIVPTNEGAAVAMVVSTDQPERPVAAVVLPPEEVDVNLIDLRVLRNGDGRQLALFGPRGVVGWDLTLAEFNRESPQ